MQFSPDDLRLISIGQTVWIRMLRAREETVIRTMVANFRNGKTDFLASVAELATVRGQLHEIESAIKQLENPKE